MAELRRRARTVIDTDGRVQQSLSTTHIEWFDTGYCTAELTRVDDEHALLLHSGLTRAITAGCRLPAAYFAHTGLFDGQVVPTAAGEAFQRAFGSFMGQLSLYGRITRALPPPRPKDIRVANHLATEALLFVTAHELGHVIAGHTAVGSNSVSDDLELPEELHHAQFEVEADAIAYTLWSADLWQSPVPEGELQMRLIALRMAFHVLEIAERCALVPIFDRHLPASLRWAALRQAIANDIPTSAATDHDMHWRTIVRFLHIGGATDVLPPDDAVIKDFSLMGWTDKPLTDSVVADWSDLETATHQFRLPRPVLDVLIGVEITDPHGVGTLPLPELELIGRQAVDELAASLPRWLLGRGRIRATSTSSDLIYYLRSRDRWPEPLRSDDTIVLPIHTMAAAIADQVNSTE